jgi:hypothetical protein
VETLQGCAGGLSYYTSMYIRCVTLPCSPAENSAHPTSPFCCVAYPHRYSPTASFPRKVSAGINSDLCRVCRDELIHDRLGRHPDMVRGRPTAHVRVPPSSTSRARQYWHAIHSNQRSPLSFKIIILLVESGAMYFVIGVRFLSHETDLCVPLLKPATGLHLNACIFVHG